MLTKEEVGKILERLKIKKSLKVLEVDEETMALCEMVLKMFEDAGGTSQ